MVTQTEYWNVDKPLKPWGWFDPDAELTFPFNWVEWLAQIGGTYQSHSIIVEDGLTCPNSTQSAGIISPLIKRDTGKTLAVNKQYAVTCRITALDGLGNTQKDDRTVYLKIMER